MAFNDNDPSSALGGPSVPDLTQQGAAQALAAPLPVDNRTAPPSPVQPQAPPQKPSVLSTILHAVGDALGGPKTGDDGQPISTAARTLHGVGTIIQGAAAGAAQHGPGSVGASALAGAQVQQRQAQQQKDNTLANSKQSQDELLAQAQLASHAVLTAKTGWEFARLKKVVSDEASDKFGAIDSFIGGDPRNRDLGTFPTFQDFLDKHPEMMAQEGAHATNLAGRGLIVNTIPTDEKGVAQGVHVWRLDPNWKQEPMKTAMQYRQPTGNGEFKSQILSAGTNNNADVLGLLQNDGYGALGVQEAEGPKTHEEAIAHLANGTDVEQAQAQRFLDTESKLSKGDALSKLENTPSMLARENASAAIPQLNNMLSTEQDPGKRVRITRLLATAQAAHQGYTQDLQSDAQAKTVAAQGSPVDAGRLLADGSLTLADLKTRGLTPAFILQATNNAQKINPQYKPSDEVVAESISKSPQANQFFGSSNSLISKGGTLDQLATVGAKIPQNKIPILNKVEDWQKLASGSGPLAGYAATVLGVADDYGKVLGGGAASDNARNSALALVGAAASPEARASAIDSIRNSVVSQTKERIGTNQFLKRQYGYALDYSLQEMAARPQFTQDRSGPLAKPSGQFSLSKWLQANPQGDANAAATKAKQRGITVLP